VSLRTNTCIHIYIHTYVRTCTHTHTHTPNNRSPGSVFMNCTQKTFNEDPWFGDVQSTEQVCLLITTPWCYGSKGFPAVVQTVISDIYHSYWPLVILQTSTRLYNVLIQQLKTTAATKDHLYPTLHLHANTLNQEFHWAMIQVTGTITFRSPSTVIINNHSANNRKLFYNSTSYHRLEIEPLVF